MRNTEVVASLFCELQLGEEYLSSLTAALFIQKIRRKKMMSLLLVSLISSYAFIKAMENHRLSVLLSVLLIFRNILISFIATRIIEGYKVNYCYITIHNYS